MRPAGPGAASRAALLCLALATAASAAAAPPAAAREPGAAFVPERFGPGREVRAVLLLPALEAASGFSLGREAGLPASEDPELRGLELARTTRGWELRVDFVPSSPGPGAIPPIAVRGLSFPSIPYNALSVLGPGDREPSPPRAQREPPGAALYLYALAGAALLAILGALGCFAYLVPGARALLRRRRAARAYRRLCESLDFLVAGAADSDPRSFYAALSRALRLYLELRVEERASALTASELAALPSSAFPATGLRDEAAGILSEAERARYAGERPGAEAMASSARRARELASAAEEALDARL